MAGRKRKKGGKVKSQTCRALIRPPQVAGHERQLAAWRNAHGRASRGGQTYPVVRLTEDGPDYGTWPQPGDEIGYGMGPIRRDNCLQAAVATALQHPIERVPDLRIDERIEAGEDPRHVSDSSWLRIMTWADRLGLTLTFHDDVLPVDRDRWIGVCPCPEGSFMLGDHGLVMRRAELLFDPSLGLDCPPGTRPRRFDPADIAYGITFDSRGEQ
jgi:hypothetical protein